MTPKHSPAATSGSISSIPLVSVSSSIPAELDATEWSNIEPHIRSLLERPVNSPADLEAWLLDRSELEAACSQTRAGLYIAMTANTEHAEINAAYGKFIESIGPKLEEAAFELDRRFVELAGQVKIDSDRYRVLLRNKKTAVEIFRTENVPIQTELAKLGQDYSKIAGAQMVTFDGREQTPSQMAVYQQNTDRSIREGAWRAVAKRRLEDRAALDRVLDEMVKRRHAVAKNAGFSNYVDYAFKDMRRFDYTPTDCQKFWGSVEKHVVPMMRRLDERRRQALKIESLRPWDLGVDTKGRAGLKPFTGGRELFDKSIATMDALDPRLGKMLRTLGRDAQADDPSRGFVTACLDLDSRRGKRPGGYMYVRDRSREPFIFMNAAGLHRDVMTMVHEAGHAFHSMLAAPEWLVDYRESPIEFAEVASMSMEHLTMPHWGVAGAFYSNEEDLNRARREHLEDSLTILSWIATIDSFQHWMYGKPEHTHAQRDDFWIELDQRFGHALSWNGMTDERRTNWQRQGHLFSHPMYYIEYGIAQLGSLQLWLRSKKESERAAVDGYTRALALGGSKPLPQLFEAAGIRFDFGDKTVASIVEAVERELETMRE